MKSKKHLCVIPCNSLPLLGEAGKGIVITPFSHSDRKVEFNVLIYIIKGEMEIVEDGEVYELTPNTLFFLKCGVHHWGGKPFERGTAWYYIHFYTDEVASDMLPVEEKVRYDKASHLTPHDYNYYMTLPKMFNIPIGSDLENKMMDLINQYQALEPVSCNILLWQILLYCYELQGQNPHRSEKDARVRAVITYLERHYCTKVSTKELEEILGLSYKYIGELFKAKTGMTIKQYQLMLQMEKAVKLLSETQLSIAEIAEATGFYDMFHFSKIFKREKHISPLKFRQTYKPKI